MKGAFLLPVLRELPRDCAHERVGAKLFYKLEPTSNARRVCFLGGLLDAIRNRLFSLITEFSDRVEQRGRYHRCHGHPVWKGTRAYVEKDMMISRIRTETVENA